jgi:hypothetical protein
MTTQTEALKMTRQLLWRYRHETPIGNQPHMICHEVDEAFERIDEALAQPEQEPVAWTEKVGGIGFKEPMPNANYKVTATIAPQRTWVGLTMQDVKVIEDNAPSIQMAIFMAEATLKDKNYGS